MQCYCIHVGLTGENRGLSGTVQRVGACGGGCDLLRRLLLLLRSQNSMVRRLGAADDMTSEMQVCGPGDSVIRPREFGGGRSGVFEGGREPAHEAFRIRPQANGLTSQKGVSTQHRSSGPADGREFDLNELREG